MATNSNASRVFTVKNRSDSTVVYKIPELGVRRQFAPGEVKKIGFSELEALSFQPGGRTAMVEFLQIQEDVAANALNIHREAEYYMSEAQIIQLLKTGSQDAFLDCLDFAPIGVVELVKKYAVQLPLTDTEKIKALKEKTGFDTTKAIELSRIDNENTAKPEERAAEATPMQSGRRTASNYKVVNKE